MGVVIPSRVRNLEFSLRQNSTSGLGRGLEVSKLSENREFYPIYQVKYVLLILKKLSFKRLNQVQNIQPVFVPDC